MTALNQNTDFQKISRSEFEAMDCKLIKQEKSGHGPMAQNSTDYYMTSDGRTVVHSHAMGGESFTISIKKFMTTKLMALESISRFIGALGVMVNDPDSDGDIVFGRAVAAALEADIAKGVEPVEYQILLLGTRWTHCAKHIYDTSTDKSIVRALYTTPQEPAAIPAGWKLVPIEPTREMWKTTGDAVIALQKTGTLHHDKISNAVSRAMLEAAPGGAA